MNTSDIRTAMLKAPHYEIASTELAKWLDEELPESWWNVDGDPLLTGRLSIPCPTDELTLELRKLDRPLLILARGSQDAHGQVIDSTRVGELASFAGGRGPRGEDDLYFDLVWKGNSQPWLLIEDLTTAKQYSEDAISLNSQGENDAAQTSRSHP